MPEFDSSFDAIATMPPESSSGIFPIFHHETRLDQEATDAAGKNIYKKVPYVEIIAPGNDKEKINRAVKEEDKLRWPKQWAAFERGQEEPEFDGMPISEWALADKHLVRTLKESNVFTVEQLANVADIDIQVMGMGMVSLKNRAIEWLKKNSQKDRDLEKAQSEIEKLKAMVDELREKSEHSNEVRVEPIMKNGGWYTFRGKKYREADLPEEAVALFKECGG